MINVNIIHKIDLVSFSQAAAVFVSLCLVACYILAKYADP